MSNWTMLFLALSFGCFLIGGAVVLIAQHRKPNHTNGVQTPDGEQR